MQPPALFLQDRLDLGSNTARPWNTASFHCPTPAMKSRQSRRSSRGHHPARHAPSLRGRIPVDPGADLGGELATSARSNVVIAGPSLVYGASSHPPASWSRSSVPVLDTSWPITARNPRRGRNRAGFVGEGQTSGQTHGEHVEPAEGYYAGCNPALLRPCRPRRTILDVGCRRGPAGGTSSGSGPIGRFRHRRHPEAAAHAASV